MVGGCAGPGEYGGRRCRGCADQGALSTAAGTHTACDTRTENCKCQYMAGKCALEKRREYQGSRRRLKPVSGHGSMTAIDQQKGTHLGTGDDAVMIGVNAFEIVDDQMNTGLTCFCFGNAGSSIGYLL